jgi:hypothetical protein
MKFLILLLTFIVSLSLSAQIITNDQGQSDRKEKQEKDKPTVPSSKSGIEIYAGFSPSFTYRTLQENDGIFGDPLGERENEIGEWVSSFEAGVRNDLNNNLQLQIGLGFARNRESYSFESADTDSVYGYINTYRHVSFPIRLSYEYGEEISFFGGIGLMPKAFVSMEKIETVIDINNQESDITSIVRDGFNFFVVDAIGSLGTKIQFNENYGIYAQFQARRQLSNNYDSQSPYTRRPYALGFNMGIQIYL